VPEGCRAQCQEPDVDISGYPKRGIEKCYLPGSFLDNTRNSPLDPEGRWHHPRRRSPHRGQLMATATQDLELFARESLLRGHPRADIKEAMVQAGWTDEQAGSALGAFAESAFPVPVPRPRPYLSAREAFFYLLLFSALYLSAYHLGSLVFDFINRFLPDAAAPNGGYAIVDSMRFSTASLIIAVPLFLFLSTKIARDLDRKPVKRLSSVRRWLTYLTLFAAATILVGDLITLVYDALGGELTLRFILKVVTVAVISGAIFWHYLSDLHQEERE
jgi:hypothetical protein